MGVRRNFRRLKAKFRLFTDGQQRILDQQQDILTALQTVGVGAGRQRGWRRAPIYMGDRTLLAETEFLRKIYLDASDISVTPHIALDGIWEPALTAFYKAHLEPGQTFVDVGANCGFFSMLAADIVGPEGAVIAVEPQARLAKLIEKSLSVNGFDGFSRCRNLAIGSEETTAFLEKSDDLSGSASIPGLGAHKDSVEEVRVTPLHIALDEVSDEMGRKILPDVMKIDSEGYEWEIWKGASELFSRCTNLLICLEFSPIRYHELGTEPMAFIDRIEADGFSISELMHDGTAKLLSKSELAEVARVKHGHHDLILRKGR